LILESDAHLRLDLDNKDIREQIRQIIQREVTRANLQTARGTVSVSIPGGPPFVVALRRLEIQEPNFSELRSYVESQSIDQIRQFINQYHSINQRELDGQATALFYAARNSDVKALQTLLALGADPNIPDSNGDTPLAAAALANCVEAARQLIQAGAKVNKPDEKGVTPLMWAAWKSRYEILQLLLRSGADPNYVSSDGNSALRIARQNGSQAIITALQRAGASK
jgi:ankyrin repeat protein